MSERILIADTLQPRASKTVNVVAFRIRVIDITLHVSAKIAVYMECDCSGNRYEEYKEVVVSGPAYTSWGSDDKYIEDYIRDNHILSPILSP